MSKKKHQRDPNNEDESSETGDDNQNSAECRHIGKAVDLGRLKKSLVSTGFLTECEECNKEPADADTSDMAIEYDMSLWLCLKCGHQACGRAKNKHALRHHGTPHSDSHAMCVNTTIWSIWCYDCNDEVNITCKKKLQETVEYLKKQAESNKIKQKIPTPQIEDKVVDLVLPQQLNNNDGLLRKLGASNFTRARGLTNLGNTCFFNSVMQCLGQTPYLLQLLDETENPGQKFKLPGGTLKLPDKQEIQVPPLEGETEKWNPLTQTLAETLKELQSGRPEVYNPRALLNRLTGRMPQFGGGDQHDAHELLRHLLEAVREDDLKRFYSVILEKLGFTRKTDPATVDDEKKRITKFYGQQVSEMLLATEQVFRGVLISTLQCQVCHHVSHRDEFFLDLSLPICEKQLAPVLRRKAEEIEDAAKPSKYQIKKEKRAEKKKKNKKHQNQRNGAAASGALVQQADDVFMENKSESESDADVEDNAEEPPDVIALPAPPQSKGTESGYNSDKVDNSSPDSNNHRTESPVDVDDSGVPSPTAAGGAPSVSPTSIGNSPASSETNVDMGSPLLGHNSPDEEYGECAASSFQTRPMSRLAFVGNTPKGADLKVDLEKLSLLNDGDSVKVDDKMDDDDDEEGGEERGDDAALIDWSGTLASRYVCEEGECSVESCLNQFTECELMMGTNKVSCDRCTRNQPGPAKKTVYTDASKQLLIYNPPAVLILHLKRFQVYRYRSAKVSKFVKFSALLDLGPFCSKKSRSLPTFVAGQSKVLYSLYGVVEHSGSIHGGHYVAYIKVRAPLDDRSPRWNFIPKNQKGNNNNGTPLDPEPPPGKWYYISDSYVSEVSESKVLSAQAYLLFYERIL
ncbi:ubiquitin carboxyl-terminal hydrolase 16/45 [Cylas formicarius]|uniref:ubiquitin carboxyl-terminal hydrolase 16/45 n=1 Tax=Cylas formicarius TaxID=197179 RepID=UPI002958BEEF|nr:ubiquitin carboxyl-terminal hydrolase 16/45 [Cylas formicarius]